MRLRANVLLSIGTILATLGGARLPDVAWGLVAVGSLVLMAGGVMHRVASSRERVAIAATEVSTVESMRDLVAELEALVDAGANLSLPEIVEKLDALEHGPMGQVAEAIPRQLAVLGGARFAEVYGEYAAGERLIHRAWSAAADGHREEATRSLLEGRRRIEHSLGMLEEAA